MRYTRTADGLVNVAARLLLGVDRARRQQQQPSGISEMEEHEMAKRITERQRLAFKLDALNDAEVKEVLDYIAIMESMRRARAHPSVWEDELVALLADSRENLRARQAFEWENARRKADRRAAANAFSQRV